MYDVALLLHIASYRRLFLLLFHHYFYLALRKEADSLSRYTVIRPYIDRCQDSRSVICDNALSLHRLGCFAAEKWRFGNIVFKLFLMMHFSNTASKSLSEELKNKLWVKLPVWRETQTSLIEYLPILDAFRWKYGYGKCKFFKIVKIIHFESKREASGSKW